MIHCNLPHRGEGVKAKNEKWRTRARIARAYRAHARGRVVRSPNAPLFPLHPSVHFHRLSHRLFTARLTKICPASNGRKTIGHNIFFS